MDKKSKPKIYLESSVISFQTARETKNVQILAKQQITHEFWAILNDYEVFISDAVLNEIERGDPIAARRRVFAIKEFSRLPRTPEVDQLVDQFLLKDAIPIHARQDAVHIAVAAIHCVDFLLTWNMTHIANPVKRQQIIEIIRQNLHVPPTILTPKEFLESQR